RYEAGDETGTASILVAERADGPCVGREIAHVVAGGTGGQLIEYVAEKDDGNTSAGAAVEARDPLPVAGAFAGIRTFSGGPTGVQEMTAARRFPKATREELATAKILGVRAGTEHRYTGVWVVVVEGRAFVRSWNDKPTGWYRAFQAEPLGSIQLPGKEIPVRARRTRSERLREAVTAADAEQYDTR